MAGTANLGTLARTCDAVGACTAVPDSHRYRRASDRGDTQPRRPHVPTLDRSAVARVARQHRRPATTDVAVEMADDATLLTRPAPAPDRTAVLLGHERHGVPDEVWHLLGGAVEVPMGGRAQPGRRRRRIARAVLAGGGWRDPTRSRNAIGLRRAPFVKDHHELTGGRHRRNDR